MRARRSAGSKSDNAELGVENQVFIKDSVSPKLIVGEASKYDIGIVALQGDGVNHCYAEPAKSWTYIVAGLCVLGTDLLGIRTIINRLDNGILARDALVSSLVDAISKLCDYSSEEIDVFKEKFLKSTELCSWKYESVRFVDLFAGATK